ncbi:MULTISPECIES: hypothetical protein [unclassified Streptomyces]|uniref:hypothetical protein n=1 Tax=unclassified Streptomyces TaxID=2593676 RepID=UPI002E794CB4|nr:hypothetical protein [Streptomyces sp. JV184]MEE1745643.1 hypothetical protein [Streptomyces sp. JV184]
MSGIIAAAIAVRGALLDAALARYYQEESVERSARERDHQRLLDAVPTSSL